MQTRLPEGIRRSREALPRTPFAVEVEWDGTASLVVTTARQTSRIDLGRVWDADRHERLRGPLRALLDRLAEELRAERADARRNAREDPKTWD